MSAHPDIILITHINAFIYGYIIQVIHPLSVSQLFYHGSISKQIHPGVISMLRINCPHPGFSTLPIIASLPIHPAGKWSHPDSSEREVLDTGH